MPSFTRTLLALAISPIAVLGHGHVRDVIVNGVTYPGYERYENQDLSKVVGWPFTTEDEGPVPVSSLNDPDIICHQGATNAKASVPLNAGDEITIRRFNEIGGFEHPGPELHYLAPCGDEGCDKVDKTKLEFFKFYELGLVKAGEADDPEWDTQRWATTEVHKHVYAEGDGFIDTFNVTIPKNIKPGPYVLRHELFGLHMADQGKAEFYPQCINLVINGSGTESPKGTPATEFYKNSDPGIDIDIWLNLKSYEIPGPALWTPQANGMQSKRHARNFVY
ncbi:Uu.00g132760.m01.CDS01 [Anthostomella pinea]|uniref:lytic cellulose monooxygenase (C4-dehydrogenating) n=1 Tax=Anthostomella pinea TaxID=933095 RepID=A0AAI8VSU6_9PEZI|nr:Uu.00g132760.m01.CDS01 [Anthostomella pinea]